MNLSKYGLKDKILRKHNMHLKCKNGSLGFIETVTKLAIRKNATLQFENVLA